MNWLNTLFSPNGFLFHVVGIVALTVLLCVGVGPATGEWGALLLLLGISAGTGSQVLASNGKTPPAA